MYLKICYPNGKKYLAIAHGYRDPKTKKTLAKTIQSLGYVDELEKVYPDPIAHFKEVVAKMNAEEAAKKALCRIEIDPKAAIDGDGRKLIGYAPLSQIYHNLGLKLLFDNRSRYTNAEYSVNDIVKTEIYSRILFPGSKKSAFERKGLFFEKNDYSLDDVYRCLSFLNSFKDDILLHLHDKITEKYGRTTELMYYDVTNYYFEIDKNDEDTLNGAGRVLQEGLRKKGVNKEHRPDPIVQMGLLQDVNGIPVTYKLFAGNANDCETLVPIMKEIKRDFNVKKTIVVADKGLNTSPNIIFNILKGDGYVFSQTVRGGNKEFKDYVLNQSGYRKFGKDANSKLKSRIYPREIYVTDIQGKEKKFRIDEKQVVFYSQDYDKRAKAEREATVLKARDLVKNPAKYNRTTSYGAAKYVKNLEFDKETGEVLTVKSVPVFNAEKLAEEEIWDGYYAVVTSELDKSDEEIIEIYRGLWKIEESFKVSKSGIKSRPVFVSRQEHIQAHFLICFIALTIIRILEKQLDNKFSAAQIAESLRSVVGFPLQENWYHFAYADDVSAQIQKTMDIPLTNKFLTTGDIKKILGNTKK